MGILLIIGLFLVLALVFGPQIWVKHVISKYSVDDPGMPGTAGELAEHLIKHFHINKVDVETTDVGDHYDPKDRTVRLLPAHHGGRSISAIAIAAHEVGHAIQHHEGNRSLQLRQSLVKIVAVTDKIAVIFFMVAPVLAALARTPAAFIAMFAIGLAFMALRLVVHLVTLPVEWDASFNKALPILEKGGYLSAQDIPAARKVLKAAALTYVSAALASLLDIARWIRILR